MNPVQRILTGVGLLLADVALLSCCLTFTVIIQKTERTDTDLLLWILLVFAAYAVNLILCKKQARLSTFLICNGVWMAVSAVLAGLAFSCAPASPLMRLIVCGVILLAEGHSCFLALRRVSPDHPTAFFDALLIVTALLLLGSELRGLRHTLPLQLLCFAALACLLISLICLRTSSEKEKIIQGGSAIKRTAVFAGLGGIAAACCALCAALALKAEAAAKSIWEVFLGFWGQAKEGIARLFDRLNTFFARLKPDNPNYTAAPAGQAAESAGQETWVPTGGAPSWLFAVIAAAILILLAIFAIRFFKRVKNKNILSQKITGETVVMEKQAITQKRPSSLQKLLKKIRLMRRMYRQRKTPAGLARLTRKKGAAAGLPMRKDETWHGYVKRLAGAGNLPALADLSVFFEQYFYSKRPLTLSQEQYRQFVRELNGLRQAVHSSEDLPSASRSRNSA